MSWERELSLHLKEDGISMAAEAKCGVKLRFPSPSPNV